MDARVRSSRLPDVSTPLARLLDTPSTSTPSFAFARQGDRWVLSRSRKLIVFGAAVLSFALFLILRDLSTLSAQPEAWQQPTAPPLLPSLRDALTVTTTVTTTFTAPATTETASIDAPSLVDPVAFVLIAWSEDAASEAALLIKSVLIYNSSPSEFHIICDDPAEKYIRARLALIRRPLHPLAVRFYQPTLQSMMDRIDREGSIHTDHSAGAAGLMKLFIHEILPPSVKKVIFVDTDAMLIADPTLLWNTFDDLKPTTAFVMASHPDHEAEEWHNASRICSCVMLLNLQKFRDMRLMDSSIYRADTSGRYPPALAPSAFRAMYGQPNGEDGRYDNVRLGDQGYWWAIVDHNPQLFEPLSYDFEVTSCLVDSYLTGLGDEMSTEEQELSRQTHVKGTPQEGIVILPKLLHFNCLHGTPRYLEWPGWSDPTNPLTVRWGPAVTYHVGFKWIWLNKGKPNATSPDITTTSVKFADEQFADQHPH
ncbi:hypothetical protein C8F04DRAFT_944400 [Mycena alexandri]|uniref:Glycosyltransferase family 8 protein n=1 Tax=Mycena alexandri TaxID=1745969 RepID=A0AAD6TG94_9AGAR|nr:hypothetical protein C8F04DRAFT_944400 [Mycena alexandri]